MAGTPLVAWMNPLPLEVAPALATRRKSVAAKATGRVLDLGGWNDHLGHYRMGHKIDEIMLLVTRADLRSGSADRDPSGITRVDAGFESLIELGIEPFDTIVSLIRTPLISDLARFIRAVEALLAPAGRLQLLEPVRRHGRLGRMLTLGGTIMSASGGLHLDRDIPARLREADMTVTDLDRFDVPTVSAPLRPFIEATARRFNSVRS